MSSDSEEDANLKEFLEECVDRAFARSAPERVEKDSTKRTTNHKSKAEKQKTPTQVRPPVGHRKPSKRALAAAEGNDQDDEGLPAGMKTFLAKQLDSLLEKSIKFRDTDLTLSTENGISESDPEGIKLFSSTSSLVTELVERPEPLSRPRPKLKKIASDAEKITREDLESIAVSADWVLNRRGIYGKGREKQGEVITGAVHSPSLSKRKTPDANKT